MRKAQTMGSERPPASPGYDLGLDDVEPDYEAELDVDDDLDEDEQ